MKEVFIINKKAIIYKGSLYVINDFGFYLRDDKYRFLFIPIAKPKIDEASKKKIEEALDEIRSK